MAANARATVEQRQSARNASAAEHLKLPLGQTENSQAGLFRRTLSFARAASKIVREFLAWNNSQAEQNPGAPEDSIEPGYRTASAASKEFDDQARQHILVN
jgi:hypothetical protein